MTIANINIDTILSQPLLMVAAAFIVLGPILFLVALIQFFRSGRKKTEYPAFEEDEPLELSSPSSQETAPVSSESPEEPESTEPSESIYIKGASTQETPEPVEKLRNVQNIDTDKTVVMASGVGEVQGQLEIAFSQIKSMNKKISQLESDLETLSRNAATKLEPNELKEAPMNPADFTAKLLKLAEHVIVLEKEVSRLKSTAKPNGNSQPAGGAAAPAESQPSGKPPILPI